MQVFDFTNLEELEARENLSTQLTESTHSNLNCKKSQ